MADARTPIKLGWSGPSTATAVSFEVWNIYDLIDVIRRKCGLYIGEPSITALDAFVKGFVGALHAAGRPLDPEHPSFRGFHDWIASRYGFGESTPGWKNMLLTSLGDEAIAFERFFVELDEYREAEALPSLRLDQEPGPL